MRDLLLRPMEVLKIKIEIVLNQIPSYLISKYFFFDTKNKKNRQYNPLKHIK